MGDAVYEDSGGRPPDAADPAPAPDRARPAGAVLRLELHGVDERAPTLPRPDGGGHRPAGAAETTSPSQSLAVLADRMAVEPGRLSVWHAGELVFRSPVAALISIAFEAHGDPEPALAAQTTLRDPDPAHAGRAGLAGHAVAEDPEGPHGEVHRDLPSANTRWAAADEHRLLELHAAGVPIDELARAFGRRKGAVRARLFKLRHATGPGRNPSGAEPAAAPAEDGEAQDRVL